MNAAWDQLCVEIGLDSDAVDNIFGSDRDWLMAMMVGVFFVEPGDRLVTRRRFLLMGGISLIAAHPLSRGQVASVIRRVGVLLTTSEATNAPLRAAFSQAMRDRGWVEGTNIEYRIVSANATWTVWTRSRTN